ncbi:Condensin complex subunit 1 [Holothuria leucospilota]|uniref:Condensin complex subunit 1 n=1 Tax=Holothuria leucospilota TaxID=206669 RepID=A0A9Q0YFH2_HOLLE|nr:Condensin complex subunit 1 [Holothuria leucospilota]
MEFVIPLNQKGLLEPSGTNQYVVDEVFPVRQLTEIIISCRSAVRSRGYQVVVDNFDAFFSLLRNFNNLGSEVREEAWDILLTGALSLISNLSTFLEEVDIDPTDKGSKRNAVKMLTYLLCQMADAFEAETSKPSIDIATSKRGKSKKKTVAGTDWESERANFLETMVKILQLEINRLWEPPVVEEEFVNLVSGSCYKMLENPEVMKNKVTKDNLVHVLAILVKRYNHALSASVKLLLLLQHFEHLTIPLAQAIQTIVTVFGVKSIVGEIIRELGRMDQQDLARDNSGTRGYAGFISELSDLIPDAILPSISLLLIHLDGESYTMRNGVLTALGNIVCKVLSGDGLTDKSRITRDQLLDKLEDHIHDVNAFCRSKALQIWLMLCQHRAIPLARQQVVLELTVGRLYDKSSLVRKFAIQLLTALLTSNPFAAKLPVSELESSLEKEKEKLAALIPQNEKENGINEDKMVEWKNLEEQLKKIYNEVINNPENTQESSVEISEDRSLESVTEEIKTHLTECNFLKAIQLLQAAKECWSDEGIFAADIGSKQQRGKEDEEGEEDDNDDGDDGDDDADKELSEILKILKVIYMGESVPKAGFEELDIESLQRLAEAGLTGNTNTEVENITVSEVTKQQVLTQYLQDCVNFAKLVQKAVPILCELLVSKTNSDVLEAVSFFVSAFEFGVTSSHEGVRKMMVLVWSKEQAVKEAVVNAYRRLYLNPDGPTERARCLHIVRNLMALMFGATIGQMTSLEELICEFVRSKELPKQVFQLLWEIFTGKHPDMGDMESRAALKLLGMAAGADMDLVHSNTEVLVTVGLGERAKDDFLLARDTCVTLLKLGGSGKPKASSKTEPLRFPSDHRMFTQLADILVTGLTKTEDNHWLPLAEQAVKVIFLLGEHPEVIVSDIIKRLALTIMEDQENGSSVCPAPVMSRFLGIVGHTALQMLMFLDVYLLTELKRRNNIREGEKNKEEKKRVGSKSKNDEVSEEGDIEDEMGLTGASAEDAEAEFIRKICETDIVNGPNLLAAIEPLVVHICSNPSKYSDPSLQATSSLTLAKFMLVSSETCEKHLQLLFTILERVPQPHIRANTIIAIGDLTFRFPNLIEPWTPNLYARLRDPSVLVRKNTLLVLTHLILNDMVKVKGQISEMATCIVDSEERLAALAKLFFFELSKKGNAIYNIMPDIISRLSDPDIGLPEDQFRTILRYLFAFIQKDRQAEALVEKLCHRFRASRSEQQSRELAYCLSLLNYNDKSVRKLQENLACYAEKLSDKEVYGCFTSILSKSKKFIKQESKALFDDFEAKLLECHQKGVADEVTADKANKASAAAKATKPAKTPARKIQSAVETPTTQEKTSNGAATTGRKRRNRKALQTPKDSQNALDASVEKSQSSKKGRPKHKVPAPILFSSDEDSDDDVFAPSQLKENAEKEVNQSGDELPDSDTSEKRESLEKENLSPGDTPQTGKSTSKRHRQRVKTLKERNQGRKLET